MINYILINIFLIISIIYIIKKSKHSYHILQLESYKNKRFLKWIIKKKTIKIKEIILLFFEAIIFYNQKFGLIVSSIYILILLIIREKYIEKKPLVFTARIKRMYTTEIITLLILVILANIYNNNFIITITVFAIIFNYIYIMIINIINYPIEKINQIKYYKKAKNKLKENSKLKIIGVTGSYGKTSVKNILGTILEQKYNTLITPESYNTTMGVVRTINENLSPAHEVFVCEMGAKNIGDIKEICNLVKPQYGVLTAIGPQHLETFKTIENVKKTKLELINSLPQEGIAFINNNDENINKIKFKKAHISFGLNKDSDYYADNIKIDEMGSTFDLHTKQHKILKIKTKLLGINNIINITGAVSIASELGLSETEIITGIRLLKPIPHRLELKKTRSGAIILDDAYNSNVKGANMALDVLSKFKEKYKILITPGMVELGEKTAEYNKNFGRKAAKSADYIILVGEEQTKPIKEGMEEENFEKNKIYIAKNLNEAIEKMNQIINQNSVILFENDLPDNYL